MMGLQYKLPVVTSATVSPNPVNINTVFKLVVAVAEQTIELDAESIFANEVYSGEMT